MGSTLSLPEISLIQALVLGLVAAGVLYALTPKSCGGLLKDGSKLPVSTKWVPLMLGLSIGLVALLLRMFLLKGGAGGAGAPV